MVLAAVDDLRAGTTRYRCLLLGCQGLFRMRTTPGSSERHALRTVKIAHTVVWAFFAGSIFAIPVFSFMQAHRIALGLIGIVSIEVLVLAVNGMSCPLTSIAARYTNDRRANFDIYLPEWLARHNKVVFGSLYLAGILIALVRWSKADP